MPFTFEQAQPGDRGELPGALVSAEDIIAFAREYDPQDFHIDPELARDTFVGELIASGWHTCSIAMRAVADGLLAGSTGLGAPGIEEVEWLKPVRPGDRLRSRLEIVGSRRSTSRPDRGVMHFDEQMLNQNDEIVATMRAMGMYRCRPAEGSG